MYFAKFRAEGENPVIPQPTASPKSDNGDDQFDEDQDEQCKNIIINSSFKRGYFVPL